MAGASLFSVMIELGLLTYSTYGLTSDTQMIQLFRITVGSQMLRGEHSAHIGFLVMIYDQSPDSYMSKLGGTMVPLGSRPPTLGLGCTFGTYWGIRRK